MSLQNRTYWTCNECGKEEWTIHYGFPSPGWKWFLQEGTLNHACGYCAERLIQMGARLAKDDDTHLVPETSYSSPIPEPVEALEPYETGKVPPDPSKGLHGASGGVETASSLESVMPMPRTGDWKKEHVSWEGFCGAVHKSIGKDLGGGSIQFVSNWP